MDLIQEDSLLEQVQHDSGSTETNELWKLLCWFVVHAVQPKQQLWIIKKIAKRQNSIKFSFRWILGISFILPSSTCIFLLLPATGNEAWWKLRGHLTACRDDFILTFIAAQSSASTHDRRYALLSAHAPATSHTFLPHSLNLSFGTDSTCVAVSLSAKAMALTNPHHDQRNNCITAHIISGNTMASECNWDKKSTAKSKQNGILGGDEIYTIDINSAAHWVFNIH